MVIYRELSVKDLNIEIFAGFQRRQDVTRCWRKVTGQWVTKDIAFVEDSQSPCFVADISKLSACLLS